MAQDTNKKLVYLTLTIHATLQVSEEVSNEEAIEEFVSDCDYDFPSSGNIQVLRTSWENTEERFPMGK